MSFVKPNVIYDPCESITYDDQTSQKLNHNGKAGIGFQKPENSKPSWLKNKLDKDKAKADRKPFVPNQSWRSSTKTLTDSSTGKTVKVIQVCVPKGSLCILNSFLVDWAVKMRIRPPELETSICDVKYHVSLPPYLGRPSPPLPRRRRPSNAAAGRPPPSSPDFHVVGLVSISATRRIRSCQNPSDLLVQIYGGIAFLVVDLIRRSTAAYNSRAIFPVILFGAGRLDVSKVTIDKCPMNGCRPPPCAATTTTERAMARAQPRAGLRNMLRKGRPPCVGVAHGDAQAAPCMAWPCLARRCIARPCAVRYMVATAAVRICSRQRCDG
ncbi:hypothetical protein F511_19495 [Dorcoceras hygrometricum]|uniref:Uncharacterized protein n=1 Tax=Dorcoceras hygrometricum TaxID=472368 RepID=A0A2Z7CAG4_9LAMI|nr:hypothetical protein F511_19495 [Dorcoceras hygrometricum]